jgi:hypothetical protein
MFGWRRKRQPQASPLAIEFARRLARAVWLRKQWAHLISDAGVRQLDHAAFSAYLDLRALGAVDGQSFRREDTGHGAGDAGSNPAAQPAQEGGRYERP